MGYIFSRIIIRRSVIKELLFVGINEPDFSLGISQWNSLFLEGDKINRILRPILTFYILGSNFYSFFKLMTENFHFLSRPRQANSRSLSHFLQNTERSLIPNCVLLGTPDTNLSGLSTLMALSVLRSTPSSTLTPPVPTPALLDLEGSSGLKMVMYLEWGSKRAKKPHKGREISKNK